MGDTGAVVAEQRAKLRRAGAIFSCLDLDISIFIEGTKYGRVLP